MGFSWDFSGNTLLKRLYKLLLKKKLGDLLLGDIDLDQLDVQLSKGMLHLSDLALNADFINEKLVGSGVRVKEGSIYSLGTCNINGKFDQKTIELIVTTYQAAALLLFNSSKKLSYSEIMTQLNLTDDDVVRLLHSLSCAKYKILNNYKDHLS